MYKRQADIFVDWHEVWSAKYWREYAGPVAGAIGSRVEKLCLCLCPNAMVFWDANAHRLRDAGYRRNITVLSGLLPARLPESEPNLEVAGPPTIVFAGRHIRDKAPHVLPEMLEHVRRSIPTARLVVAGDGPEREGLAREVSRRALDDAVSIVGFLPELSLIHI